MLTRRQSSCLTVALELVRVQTAAGPSGAMLWYSVESRCWPRDGALNRDYIPAVRWPSPFVPLLLPGRNSAVVRFRTSCDDLAARPRQGGDGHAAARTGRLRTGATPGAAPVPRVTQTSPAATSPPRRSRAGREYLLYPRRCAQPWTGARCRWRRVHSPRWEAVEAGVAAPSRAGRPRLRWAALASSPAAG